jgi:hypothetical protein
VLRGFLLPPQPLYPLLVHQPPFTSEQRPHPTVAIARVLPSERDHALHQQVIPLGLRTAHVALGGPGLADRLTRPTLGDPKVPPNVLDGSPLPGRAQMFIRLTSFRMLMSTACSATIFFRRTISFSSSFRRLVCTICRIWLGAGKRGRGEV